MSFDTVTFWLFFALAWAAWRYIPFKPAKLVLLLLSLFFYGWWNPWYLLPLAAVAGANYFLGRKIDAHTGAARKLFLAASVVLCLGVLAFFKYTPFLVSNVTWLAKLYGTRLRLPVADWVIPIGISFYTFHILSYTIDIYRGRLRPAGGFTDFLLYLSFFPHLVAGPIVRASELLPQLRRRRRLNLKVVQQGVYLVIQGLFLKMVVADNLAPAVQHVFSLERLPELDPVSVWLGVIYFGTQIYSDFAGYSTIAIGLAYLMGLRFPQNFRYPYISAGLSEFWQRWHVTLSRWLRDYLYIPLGGNRQGHGRTYVNLLLTMLLGGLWHGASWTYVAWGGLHGAGLCVERALMGAGRPREPYSYSLHGPMALWAAGRRLLAVALVFVFVHVTWVFFRAPTFQMALSVLERMFVAPWQSGVDPGRIAQARYLMLVLPVLLLHLGQLGEEWWGLRKTALRRAVAASFMLFVLLIMDRDPGHVFIYFQF
jgi:alginate O-acetyltransferase complex protein AlgI